MLEEKRKKESKKKSTEEAREMTVPLPFEGNVLDCLSLDFE